MSPQTLSTKRGEVSAKLSLADRFTLELGICMLSTIFFLAQFISFLDLLLVMSVYESLQNFQIMKMHSTSLASEQSKS